ncbi:aglP [Symbiodinium natans]|uniref:AglP protein n=1 Tax=Symbiodinium natans TaxID=878477 RepID=A0A812LSZ5_9DINO|nr:aglP [Symbiodinium natans]
MYDESSPLRTSLSKLAGLLPVWQLQESALTDPRRVSEGYACPAGEAFLMLLDIVLVNNALVRANMQIQSNVIDTQPLFSTLEVLQARVPSLEAMLVSGWPLFGLLAVLQEGLFGLGRLAAQTHSLIRQWGTMAEVCQEAWPLHTALLTWLDATPAPQESMPALSPDTRLEALRLRKQLAASPGLCSADPGAAAAVHLLASGLFTEGSSSLWNGTGWRNEFGRLREMMDKAFKTVSWGRLVFTGWPLLALLHRLQEAYVREALCSRVERYAYAIPSRADPQSVWVCVRRANDVVYERWRMQGFFPDCFMIVQTVRELPRACPVLDIGANLGGCALMLAKDGHPVLAVEPVPVLAALLRASVERNSLTNVEVVEAAVSRSSGSGSLQCVPGHSATCRVLPTGAAANVKTESLDSILRSRGWSHPCALKIDVEGSELEVVEGATRTLSRWPHIFLELHPYELRDRGGSSADTFDLLLHMGYNMFESPPCGTKVSPMERPWQGNGTYSSARWVEGRPVPNVRLPRVADHCACERECNLRLLPPSGQFSGDCRCWEFEVASGDCGLSDVILSVPFATAAEASSLAFVTVAEALFTPVVEESSARSWQQKEDKYDKVTFQPSTFNLTKERAVALQLELMAHYNTPAFQKQLHELARTLGPSSSQFRSALCKLVRRIQLNVIPRYGFDGSEEGVQEMLRAFKALEKDPDIEVNGVAIKELLSVEVPPMEMNEKNKLIERPVTKHRILDLLRVHLIEFSKATFQADVEELKKCADYNSGRVFNPKKPKEQGFEDPDGYYHLEGRADLALIVQKQLLPQYGFEPSKAGVQDMIRHCAPFVQDRDVANLFDRVNEKLGMSTAACQRFRELVAQLS